MSLEITDTGQSWLLLGWHLSQGHAPAGRGEVKLKVHSQRPNLWSSSQVGLRLGPGQVPTGLRL